MTDQSDDGPDRYVRERDPFFVAASNDPHFCKIYDISTWQRLGSGGSGCVVRIFHRVRGEYVAVKILNEVKGDTQHKLADEVRVADRIVSNNVVRLYGPHESDKLMWIDMEYVAGPTLRAHLDQLARSGSVMPVPDAAGVALALVEGVSAIHKAGVIHRDIKPQNILLPQAGQAAAKIGDFGISRFIDADRATRTTEFRGTPLYAAPEYYLSGTVDESGNRKAAPLTPEADVYSLGVVIYESFAGRLPWNIPEDADPYKIISIRLNEAPIPARRFNPNLPEELDNLLLAMLARHPEQRPSLQYVDEVLHRVRMPVAPAAAPAAAAASRGQQRRLAYYGLALGGASLLALVIARGRSGAAGESLAAAQPTQRVVAAVTAPPPTASQTPSPIAGTSPTSTATGSPTAVAANHPSDFGVALTSEGIVLRNTSGKAIADLEFTLVTSGGAHYTASAAETVEPGGDLQVPFAFFEPGVPEGQRFSRVDVVIRHTPTGKRSFSRPL
jgi:serine/threonine-protein kinase